MCYESILVPCGSLAAMSFEIMTGVMFVVIFFSDCIFTPDSTIYSVLLIGEFGEVLIQSIQLNLGLVILILIIITATHPLDPSSLPLSRFF